MTLIELYVIMFDKMIWSICSVFLYLKAWLKSFSPISPFLIFLQYKVETLQGVGRRFASDSVSDFTHVFYFYKKNMKAIAIGGILQGFPPRSDGYMTFT